MDETSAIVDIGSPSTALLPVEPIAPTTLAPSLAEHDTPSLELWDDLPCSLAISRPELDAIERYMTDILDEVLEQNSVAKKHTPEE